MKKTYIIPEMEVVKLNAKYQLMAGSALSKESDPITDESDVLSREFDFDFDE